MHYKLNDEAGRLASLRRYDVLDTPAEAPFDKITQLVKTVLDVPIVAVSLIDVDRQWFKSCVGLEVSETARDISFCTHTIQSREPMVIPDATLDPKFAENPLVLGAPYIKSYAGAPLIAPDGYALGSLCAIDTVPRQFEAWQIDVLKSFAALVVDEFELRRMTHSDSLTGALSRRAFLVEAERAISHFFRHDLPSAIISLDVDYFKQINEAYGHPMGDAMLRAITDLLREQSQPGDLLARLGGDEFALLLTGSDIDQAVLTAQRCRTALADLTFSHDPKLRVTASFGISALNLGHVSAEKWLDAANLALDEAKETGRNKCCVQADVPAVTLDEDPYVLRREAVSAEAAPDDESVENDDPEIDFEQHRNSVTPLSRNIWGKLRHLQQVKNAKTGRLAYGGAHSGIVNCKILNLTETGMCIETSSKLTPVPEYFSVEFSEIYFRARMSRAEGFKMDLDFIFDGV
jgi:diguanylate cyclase (GGDEF)-like protein